MIQAGTRESLVIEYSLLPEDARIEIARSVMEHAAMGRTTYYRPAFVVRQYRRGGESGIEGTSLDPALARLIDDLEDMLANG